MKKHLKLLLFSLFFLLPMLAACGTGSGNTGRLSDSNASTQTSLTKLHSGGGCFTREATQYPDGDDDNYSDNQLFPFNENAPVLSAAFDSCTDSISLSINTDSYSGGTDFFQIRWARPGLAEQQFSTQARSASVTSAHFETIYSFRVQGCSSHWYGGSDCSEWSLPIYEATYAPGECHPGYVWRQANANDLVCVTPTTRDQTVYDNSQSANRVDPSGAYGPTSCKQGYVWRNAFSGDAVCVTPGTRAQVVSDNSQASQHRYQ